MSTIEEIERELIYILNDRGVQNENQLSIMTEIREQHTQEEMLQWLKDHPNARLEGILYKVSGLDEE